MFRSIVVGTDGSETASHALVQAIQLAGPLGANPHEDVDATLQAAADAAVAAGVEARTHARQGDPADAIIDVAEEQGADLIIVGNKGMTGTKRFLLGSVPNKVSHHAPCSVLIIRTT
jgi:nucleotide-binding universal stress UspA family protein